MFSHIGVAVKVDSVISTDPDCEGVAIPGTSRSSRTRSAFGRSKGFYRVAFNAVTKDVIQEAMRHPREIDEALVDAYRARRALDYLVGFTLSPVLAQAAGGALGGPRAVGRLRIVVRPRDRDRGVRGRGILVIVADLRTERARFHGAARQRGRQENPTSRLGSGRGS